MKKDYIAIAFGRRIAAERRKRDMTQQEFGEAIGMSQSMVSRMELGDTELTVRTTFLLDTALAKPRGYFAIAVATTVSAMKMTEL